MLSQFKWYRRLRGGRWGRVSGLFFDHAWIRVTDACVEDVDEDYRPKPVRRGGQGQTPPVDEVRPAPPPATPMKLSGVASGLNNMVNEARTPVVVSGTANRIAPRDLLAQGTETLLNSLGVPTELYQDAMRPSAYSVTVTQPNCCNCGGLVIQEELDRDECDDCHNSPTVPLPQEEDPPITCGHCNRVLTCQGQGFVCLPCYAQEDLAATERLYDHWLDVAHRYEAGNKKLPVILFVEIYEYFEKPVKITSVNVYRGGIEVTVEGRFGETAEVELEELSLRQITLKPAQPKPVQSNPGAAIHVVCIQSDTSEDRRYVAYDSPSLRCKSNGKTSEQAVQKLHKLYPETRNLPIVSLSE